MVLPGWNPDLSIPWWVLASGLVAAGGLLGMRTLAVDGLPRSRSKPAPRWAWRDWWVLLPILGVAIALRLWGLADRFDVDEPQLMGITTLAEWASHYDVRVHPPLLPLLYGALTGGELDLMVGRQLSVFAGVLTVALGYLAGHRGAGTVGGLVASSFIAVAPAAVHSSQLARGYGLLALGVLACHLALTHALETGRSRHWVVYSLSVAFTLGIEYIGLVPVVLDAAMVLAFTRGARSRVSLLYALAASASLVSFLAVTAFPTLRYGVPSGADHPIPGAVKIAGRSLEALGGSEPRLAFAGCLLVLALLWRRGAGLDQKRVAIQLIGVVAVVVIGAEVTYSRPRYLLHALPFFALLVAATPRALGTGLGLLLGAAFVLNNAAQLPCYFDPTCSIQELSPPTGSSQVEARLKQHPVAHVVFSADVSPSHFMWALDRSMIESKQARPCELELCWNFGTRTYHEFGRRRELDLTVVHEHNSERKPVLLVANKGQQVPHGCVGEVFDVWVELYRCSPGP